MLVLQRYDGLIFIRALSLASSKYTQSRDDSERRPPWSLMLLPQQSFSRSWPYVLHKCIRMVFSGPEITGRYAGATSGVPCFPGLKVESVMLPAHSTAYSMSRAGVTSHFMHSWLRPESPFIRGVPCFCWSSSIQIEGCKQQRRAISVSAAQSSQLLSTSPITSTMLSENLISSSSVLVRESLHSHSRAVSA